MCEQEFMMTRWISHRGESLDAPENTLAAFELAMTRNADGMETDIHLTADGVVVCCHDSDTLRTCGVSKIIEDTTFDELQALSADNGKKEFAGVRIPTLAEALRVLRPGKLFFVEIKKDDPALVEQMFMEIDRSGKGSADIVLISFFAEMIRLCQHLRPEFHTQFLAGWSEQEDGSVSPDPNDFPELLRAMGAQGLDVHGHRGYCPAELFATLRREHFSSNVWTVDDAEDAAFFMNAGADFITSNRAGELRKCVGGAAE